MKFSVSWDADSTPTPIILLSYATIQTEDEVFLFIQYALISLTDI
jgi:hypothetical protein